MSIFKIQGGLAPMPSLLSRAMQVSRLLLTVYHIKTQCSAPRTVIVKSNIFISQFALYLDWIHTKWKCFDVKRTGIRTHGQVAYSDKWVQLMACHVPRKYFTLLRLYEMIFGCKDHTTTRFVLLTIPTTNRAALFARAIPEIRYGWFCGISIAAFIEVEKISEISSKTRILFLLPCTELQVICSVVLDIRRKNTIHRITVDESPHKDILKPVLTNPM